MVRPINNQSAEESLTMSFSHVDDDDDGDGDDGGDDDDGVDDDDDYNNNDYDEELLNKDNDTMTVQYQGRIKLSFN